MEREGGRQMLQCPSHIVRDVESSSKGCERGEGRGGILFQGPSSDPVTSASAVSSLRLLTQRPPAL